jgi:tryptophanyl-tRNA synthetase
MTSLFDPAQRRENTLEVALDFLACGLDRRGRCFSAIRCPEVTN